MPKTNKKILLAKVCSMLTHSGTLTFWNIKGIRVPGTFLWSCSNNTVNGTQKRPESATKKIKFLHFHQSIKY